MKLVVELKDGGVALHDARKTVFDAVLSCYPHLLADVRPLYEWETKEMSLDEGLDSVDIGWARFEERDEL